MEEEGHLEVHGRLRKQIAIKTNLAGTMDAKTLKLQFRVGRRDLPETSKIGTPVVRRRRKVHRCALAAKQKRVEITLWEHVKSTRRNEMYWRI